MNIQTNNSTDSLWWTDYNNPGIIIATGNDVLDLLNRISTNDCLRIPQNQGVQTAFLNEKGRIIDVVSVIALDSYYYIVTSPNNENTVVQWIKKFIIMDDVKLEIVSNSFDMLSIHGSESRNFIGHIQKEPLTIQSIWSIVHCSLSDTEFIALRINPLDEMSFLLIATSSSVLHEFFQKQQDIPFHDGTYYEHKRIERGIAFYGKELTEMYNPLEANLLHLINFKKGCYIGQEVIARLDSYNKVNKRLMGIISEKPIASGLAIFNDDSECGIITSAIVSTDNSYKGLAYIKADQAYHNTEAYVKTGEITHTITIVSLPFIVD